MTGASSGSTPTETDNAGALVRRSLANFAAEFNAQFTDLLSPVGDVPPTLRDAVHYSALAPGKRIRPFLVVRCCELAGGDRAHVWPVAAAVECVHAFSLIHDDLPAMDDDDVRRGMPTSHKRFGEATAILAGDALVVVAFELLARHEDDQPQSARMIRELAEGAGWAGMIGGQTADILGQEQPPSLVTARYIHERKTARLFETACRLGGMAAKADGATVNTLGRFGQMVGRAFQIADDLLDLTSTVDQAGKAVGKDMQARKQTFPQCVGKKQSRLAAHEAADEAVAALDVFGDAAEDLRCLARYVVNRDY